MVDMMMDGKMDMMMDFTIQFEAADATVAAWIWLRVGSEK